MIGYVTLGTNDLEKASKFYDALFAETEIKRLLTNDRFIGWGTSLDQPALAITKPYNGEAATVGNGVMVALQAINNEQVDKLHQKALSLGAQDEGAAGYREEMPGFYAGYFRDLDGNKLNFYHLNTPES